MTGTGRPLGSAPPLPPCPPSHALQKSDDPARDDWVDHFPTKLLVLKLSYCHVLSDRVLRKFSRFTRLMMLDLEGCFQVASFLCFVFLVFHSCFSAPPAAD